MDKNLQNIEDLFKKGLEGSEESPSEEVWNVIDQSLEKASSLRFKKKYYALQKATAILVLVLTLLSIYVLRNQSQNGIAGKVKNKEVTTFESTVKKGTSESPESSSEKINETTAANLSEREIADENLRPDKKPEPGKSDSQPLRNSGKKIKSVIAIVSIGRKIHKVNKNIYSYKKKQIEALGVLITKTRINHPSSRSEEMNKQDLQQIPMPATAFVNFEHPEILAVNAKEKLEYITTISPYASPVTKANRTPIHIPKPLRFSATLVYSPNIPFSHLRDEDNRYGNAYSRERERNERGSYSYSFGVLVDCRLNNKWSLVSGLSLATIKMNIEPEKIFALPDNQGNLKYQINTSSGKGYILPSFSSNPQIGDSLITRKINHSLQYTEIPLAVKYFFNDKRLSVNLMAGISANILSQGKISTDVNRGNEIEHENIHKIDGLRAGYFSGLSGIGLNYNVYGSLTVTFSPTVNFAIEPINKDVPVNSYPGTVNFQLGLKTIL